MAYEGGPNKPLNPMASPYNKLLTTGSFYIYAIPPYYHHLQPLLFRPPFPSPSPSPVSQKKITSSLAPVPSGPRIPKFRRFRRVKKEKLKWVPKDKQFGLEEKKPRWKNNHGGYQKILPFDAETTSVMIRNIPNKYTRKMLIHILDGHCLSENEKNKGFLSAFDFVYLPIDFSRRRNAGFAFVNFTNPEAALSFRGAFHGKSWGFFESSKVADISKARIQGKPGLINNCKVLDLSSGSEEDMPVYFEPARDGSRRLSSKMFTVGRISQLV